MTSTSSRPKPVWISDCCSAQRAVTSYTGPAGTKPGIGIEAGAADGSTRRRIQSLGPEPPPFVGHEPTGIVTLMPPSGVVTVVAWSGRTFFSTGGIAPGVVVDCGGATVTCTWIGVVLPTMSRSVAERTWMPGASAPVLNVAVFPLRTTALNGTPSMCGSSVAASCSLATIEIEFAESTIEPSAGDEETSDGGVLSIRTLPRVL